MGVLMVLIIKVGGVEDYNYNQLEKAIIQKIDEMYGLSYIYNNPDHYLTIEYGKGAITYSIKSKTNWFKLVVKVLNVNSKSQIKQVLAGILYPYLSIASLFENLLRQLVWKNKSLTPEDIENFVKGQPSVRVVSITDLKTKQYILKIFYSSKQLLIMNGVGKEMKMKVNDELLNHLKKERRMTIFWLIISPIIETILNIQKINGQVITNDLSQAYYERYFNTIPEGSSIMWVFKKENRETLFYLSLPNNNQ